MNAGRGCNRYRKAGCDDCSKKYGGSGLDCLCLFYGKLDTPWRRSQVHHALAGRVLRSFRPRTHRNNVKIPIGTKKLLKETLEALKEQKMMTHLNSLILNFTHWWWTCWDHCCEADRHSLGCEVQPVRYHRRQTADSLYTESLPRA